MGRQARWPWRRFSRCLMAPSVAPTPGALRLFFSCYSTRRYIMAKDIYPYCMEIRFPSLQGYARSLLPFCFPLARAVQRRLISMSALDLKDLFLMVLDGVTLPPSVPIRLHRFCLHASDKSSGDASFQYLPELLTFPRLTIYRWRSLRYLFVHTTVSSTGAKTTLWMAADNRSTIAFSI